MKLSSCPICGHTPFINQISLDKGNGHGYPGHYEYSIKCSNKGVCPLSVTFPKFLYTDIYCTPKQAIVYLSDIWNEEADKINNLIKNK